MGGDSEYHCHIENEIHFQPGSGAAGIQSEILYERDFMSTMAEIRTPAARRFPVLRVVLWLLLALLLLLACVVGYAYHVAHSALPQLDGQLQVAGLSAPVTVTRDMHGVPTIEATTLEDLFFAHGPGPPVEDGRDAPFCRRRTFRDTRRRHS
jgi:hypothetical protein